MGGQRHRRRRRSSTASTAGSLVRSKAPPASGPSSTSLADFVDFGVAPAFVLFVADLHAVKSFGWIAALLFAMACALRLARFNVMLDDPLQPAWRKNFFVGMPAPAGAIVGLLPIYLRFAFDSGAPSATCRLVRKPVRARDRASDGEPRPAFFGQDGRPRAARASRRRSGRGRSRAAPGFRLPDANAGGGHPRLSRLDPVGDPALSRVRPVLTLVTKHQPTASAWSGLPSAVKPPEKSKP